jgi:hypothetical protein
MVIDVEKANDIRMNLFAHGSFLEVEAEKLFLSGMKTKPWKPNFSHRIIIHIHSASGMITDDLD